MPEAVIPFDLTRMFIGEHPPFFLAEIVFRTVLIYTYTLLLVRWIGSRSIAQLSIIEFVLVIALGSAVGDPFFYPDVPILHALVVIAVVVLINKVLDTLIFRFAAAEQAIDGEPLLVVKDGAVVRENTARRNLSDAEIFEELRLAGIRDLGEVALAYIESNGRISVFRSEQPTKAAAILPPA